MRVASRLASLGLLLVGCGTAGEGPASTVVAAPRTAPIEQGIEVTDTAHDLGRAYGLGDPHVAPLKHVAAARGGAGALTLDQLGELRLWRALDGSLAPQRVAVDHAAALSIEHDGEGGERRWRFAVVDVTGGASAWEASPDGAPQLRFRLPPTRPMARLQVMPRGRGYLALGRDGAVEWLDLEGELRQRIEAANFAVTDMVLEGDVLLLVASAGTGKEPSLRALRHRFKAGRLVFEGDPVTLDADPAQVHWDLGRDRVWFIEGRAEGHEGQLRYVDLREEGNSKWIALPAAPGRVPGGVLASGELALDWGTNGMLAVSPEGRIRGVGMRSGLGNSIEWVGGRRYAAFGEHLLVEDEASSLYLGYRRVPSAQAALSPEGEHVAYAYPGHLDIEDSEGRVRRLDLELEGATVSELTWLDDRSLLLLTSDGVAALVDAHSGGLLDRRDLHGDLVDARFDAATGTLALRTQSWGTRSILWTQGRRFGQQASVMDNASFYGVLPTATATAPGLWSFNGQNLRRYDAESLREGFEHGKLTEFEHVRPDSNTSMAAPLSGKEVLWLAGRNEGGRRRTTLSHERGDDQLGRLELGEGNPTWIRVSADGSKCIVLLTSNTGARVAYMVELETLSLSWKRTLPNDGLVEWAAGGEHLLMQSFTSGVEVWAAKNGDTERARCAFEFMATPTRPTIQSPALDYLCG